MLSTRNAFLIKWVLFGGLVVVAGVVLLWRSGVAASTKPRPDMRAASSQPTVPRPQVVVREIVRVVQTNDEESVVEEESAIDEENPVEALERARQMQAETEAQRAAYLETAFHAAAAPDEAAQENESNLTAALHEADARSTVECRSSFCRIDASFYDEIAADMALNQIFLSGEDQRVPNLASTVSRTVDDDGTAHVRIYLHPDDLAYVSSSSNE